MKAITAKADGLLFSIATGEKRFSEKAEFKKAFDDLADGIAGRHPEIERLVVAFFERPEVANGIRTNQDFKKLQDAEAFKYLSTDPLLNVGTEFEAGVREKLFAAPRRAAGLS